VNLFEKMVSRPKAKSLLRSIGSTATFVSPSPTSQGDTPSRERKRKRLSSPLSPHDISNLWDVVEVETVDEEECTADGDGTNDNEVESEAVTLGSGVDIENLATSCNVLINESSFSTFIRDNFVCKHCLKGIQKQNLVNDRIGFASNIYWSCGTRDCPGSGNILSKPATKKLSGRYRRQHPEQPAELGDYDINRQVVLACQQSGGGARMAATFGGVLSLSRRSLWIKCFTQCEEMIAIAQIALGKIILRENLLEEIAASPWNDTIKRFMLALLMDGGWDQRASGNAYNSASGRQISVGAMTKKVCFLVYFSKRCCKCEKKVPHERELCANPLKYDQSSRAMESIGAVETVLHIWKNEPNCYVSSIVTDEDSTTRSKLSHSMKERWQAEEITDAERRYAPTKPGTLGRLKGDHGVLPLDHPAIKKLSDPIHYIKNYKSELYNLVKMPKSKSETCKADAMRLSRNMAYMCAQNIPGTPDSTFEKFEIAGEASFEHHWNNHEFCGPWCQAKSWTEEEKLKKKNKYRDKVSNQREYLQQKAVWGKFTTTERMKQIYHEHDNNKTESIHGLVTNVFLPKRSYFSRAICGQARTYLAVSIDSLGYLEYNRRLYLDLGISMSTDTANFYRQVDGRRQHDQVYQALPVRKKKRAKMKFDNIQKEMAREVKDKQKGNTYESRMMNPQIPESATSTTRTETSTPLGKEEKSEGLFCKACQTYGHMRRNSKRCRLNPRSLLYTGKCVDILR
jgi:hypothetical protein